MDSITELSKVRNSNSKGVAKLAGYIKWNIDEFQMESKPEAKLMIAYLEAEIKEIKKQFGIE